MGKAITDLGEATYAIHSDFLVVARPSESAVADQNKKVKLKTFSSPWTLVESAAYTAAPPNGYYLSGSFYTTAEWTADTEIALGQHVRPTASNGYFYECVARTGDYKTHATTEPTWVTNPGERIADDAITWACRYPNVITIIEDLTSVIQVGTPLKYVYNSTTYYGMCLGIAYGASKAIALCGAPLSLSYSLTALYYGPNERVVRVSLGKTGEYDAGVADVVSDVQQRWLQADAYCVGFSAIEATEDTGANEPTVDLEVGGNPVSLHYYDAADLGIPMTTSWTDNSPVAINTTNYKIEYGEQINATVTGAGTNGNAAGLSINAIFVLE